MVRPVGRGLDPSAGGCPGDGRWREAARGVGDAAPYGLPVNGRQREVTPHPALRGHLPPRGKARVVGEGFIPPGVFATARISAGRRGRRPLRVARKWAAAGGRPSSGPAGPPSPKGEGKGCRGGIHPSRDVCGSASLRGASGTPPPTVCPGMGGSGRSRRGGTLGGAQRAGPTSNFYVSIVGAAYMPPAGFTRAPVNGSARREGS